MEHGVREYFNSPSVIGIFIMDLRMRLGHVSFGFVVEGEGLITIRVSEAKMPKILQDGRLLRTILASPNILKITHDLYEAAGVLREHGITNYLNSILDTQLAHEVLGKSRNITMPEALGVKDRELLETWGLTAILVVESLGKERVEIVKQASKARLEYAVSDIYATNRGRPISYLPDANTFGSAELWDIAQDQPALGRSTPQINVEIEPVLQLVPRELFSDFEGCPCQRLHT